MNSSYIRAQSRLIVIPLPIMPILFHLLARGLPVREGKGVSDTERFCNSVTWGTFRKTRKSSDDKSKTLW